VWRGKSSTGFPSLHGAPAGIQCRFRTPVRGSPSRTSHSQLLRCLFLGSSLISSQLVRLKIDLSMCPVTERATTARSATAQSHVLASGDVERLPLMINNLNWSRHHQRPVQPAANHNFVTHRSSPLFAPKPEATAFLTTLKTQNTVASGFGSNDSSLTAQTI
jgi:hypothetical protein